MTRLGYSKLIHSGYSYTKKRISKESTFWRCVFFQRTRCTGKAVTQQIGKKHLVKAYAAHNHLPDPDELLPVKC